MPRLGRKRRQDDEDRKPPGTPHIAPTSPAERGEAPEPFPSQGGIEPRLERQWEEAWNRARGRSGLI